MSNKIAFNDEYSDACDFCEFSENGTHEDPCDGCCNIGNGHSSNFSGKVFPAGQWKPISEYNHELGPFLVLSSGVFPSIVYAYIDQKDVTHFAEIFIPNNI